MKDNQTPGKEQQILRESLYEVLESLCEMWNQYCPPSVGHCFMSSGEGAQDVLDKYFLLKNDNGMGGEVDWERLAVLKKELATPPNSDKVTEEEIEVIIRSTLVVENKVSIPLAAKKILEQLNKQ